MPLTELSLYYRLLIYIFLFRDIGIMVLCLLSILAVTLPALLWPLTHACRRWPASPGGDSHSSALSWRTQCSFSVRPTQQILEARTDTSLAYHFDDVSLVEFMYLACQVELS